MWNINEKISKFVNEINEKISKYETEGIRIIKDRTDIQALMQRYGIKDYIFEEMDKGIPIAPGMRVTTYRLKIVTLDGLMHFYIVVMGSHGALAMDEYDLIAQGYRWKKVKIEPQYEITYGDGTKRDLFDLGV